jgi:hypothetical protein
VNTFVRLLPVICACVVTQAFAVDPPANTPEPGKPVSPAAAVATAPESSPSAINPDSNAAATTATSPTQQSMSTDAAAAASKPTRIVLDDKTLTNDEVKQLLAQGYKPVDRHGEVYYCRHEQRTGSRFATTSCKTADQIKQMARDSKDMLATQQAVGGCRGGANATQC